MLNMSRKTSKKTTQRGVAIIEALIALLILVMGVLALAQIQARMLVQTRTSNARAVAIRLIGDLGDRIRLNVAGAQPGADVGYSTTLSRYSSTVAGDFSLPAAPGTDCGAIATPCSSTERAAYDVYAWKLEVQNSLMKGQASIWQTSPRQLQIIVAWKANENTNTTLTGTATDRQVDSSLQVTSSGDPAEICANDSDTAGADVFICHIDFIDIPIR
ncbi:MAG: type IV pilus modification protein PilV [Methylobacillus sp.]|jgi:type IV pilus assembly protein PilV|nr:type IV pilus modification protein PilV [Methylobacillus sp.]